MEQWRRIQPWKRWYALSVFHPWNNNGRQLWKRLYHAQYVNYTMLRIHMNLSSRCFPTAFRESVNCSSAHRSVTIKDCSGFIYAFFLFSFLFLCELKNSSLVIRYGLPVCFAVFRLHLMYTTLLMYLANIIDSDVLQIKDTVYCFTKFDFLVFSESKILYIAGKYSSCRLILIK